MNGFQALGATKNPNIEAEGIPRVYFNGRLMKRYFAIGITLFNGTLEDRWKKLGNISELSILIIFKRAVSKSYFLILSKFGIIQIFMNLRSKYYNT